MDCTDTSIPVVRLGNLDFARLSFNETVRLVLDWACERRKGLIVTPNVDHMVTMRNDAEMQAIAGGAILRVADGMPVVWLSRLVGMPLPERVTGADLLPALAAGAGARGVSIFLLGAGPGVAARAAEMLCSHHPDLTIAGTYSPPMGFEHDLTECQRIVERINAVRPALLFVGLGAPKQEKWAARWLAQLDVGPVLGVGAAFDFLAGEVRRAPVPLQRVGLEWLWRLMMEPRRMWHRYLVNGPRFLAVIVDEIALRRRIGKPR